MGKTSRVPRLRNSCSRESSSLSSASSEVLPLRLPLFVPDADEAPLTVMAVSPYVSVRSPSVRMRSESVSRSCSLFCRAQGQAGDEAGTGAGRSGAHTYGTHTINRQHTRVQALNKRIMKDTVETHKSRRVEVDFLTVCITGNTLYILANTHDCIEYSGTSTYKFNPFRTSVLRVANFVL